jgi:two-component system sensor histidine kinase KdpD
MERGSLRVYVGYARGVGKTYAALEEARRRRDRGTDVVVGFIDTAERPPVLALAGALESVPPIVRDGAEEMDVAAVLARRPGVAVVDELAHANGSGARHTKRWEDVQELLDAGIDVITTLNIEHLESLHDVVESIGGSVLSETVPDAFVRGANQLQLVDMTPQALLRRIAHGNVYAPEHMDAELAQRLSPERLARLRELALVWMADRVDEDLRAVPTGVGPEPPQIRERIMVGVAGRDEDEALVRRAARMATRRGGELLVIHVIPERAAAEAADLTTVRALTEEVGGRYEVVVGRGVPAALLEAARAGSVTQIVLGTSDRSRVAEMVRPSVAHDVIRGSGPIDVHVISGRPSATGSSPARPRPGPSLSGRRRTVAAIAGAVVLIALTGLLALVPTPVALSTVMLLYLVVVVGVAFGGGLVPAIGAATVALALINWYFTPPVHTWKIGNVEDVVALVVFLLVAVSVSLLVDRESRHRAEAQRRRADAEAMARITARVAGEEDPLPGLVEHLHVTFGLAGASVLRRESDGWLPEASAGLDPPTTPSEASQVVELERDSVLALRGAPLPADALQLLSTFAAQLAVAVRARRLAIEAAQASALAEADALRTAILAAVSHDLRTPLASIKASVSSLRDDEIAWTSDETAEFLETIELETDRLTSLVENLLDMSRLETGALSLVRSVVGLDEVVPKALASLPDGGRGLVVDVPETLPRVDVDAGLLERAIANIAVNATAWSPGDRPPRILGSSAADRVELRVVDQGAGVAPRDRQRMFRPFQRLGDRSSGNGVGLGLAVAKGFIEAMDGDLRVEDTPGGGLTMVIGFRAATP